MYQPVGIQQLSDAQIKKLLKGDRIKIKSGSALKVSMVKEHAKKLASAAKKGAGMMIQLDPYACDLNRESLEGCGIGKKVKAGVKKIGQFVKGNKEAFRPIAASLKQAAHQSIADASMSALDDYNVDPSLVNAYAQLAHQSVQGQGIGKKITKFVRSPAVKTVRKAFKPLAQQAFDDLQKVGYAGLDLATQQALAGMSAPSGEGIGKKITKFVRSPAVKTVRKAFKPLAQQAFDDLQKVGYAGLDMATQQALASMSAPSGQGLCRGGALFPAGGALFPAGYRY